MKITVLHPAPSSQPRLTCEELLDTLLVARAVLEERIKDVYQVKVILEAVFGPIVAKTLEQMLSWIERRIGLLEQDMLAV